MPITSIDTTARTPKKAPRLRTGEYRQTAPGGQYAYEQYDGTGWMGRSYADMAKDSSGFVTRDMLSAAQGYEAKRPGVMAAPRAGMEGSAGSMGVGPKSLTPGAPEPKYAPVQPAPAAQPAPALGEMAKPAAPTYTTLGLREMAQSSVSSQSAASGSALGGIMSAAQSAIQGAQRAASNAMTGGYNTQAGRDAYAYYTRMNFPPAEAKIYADQAEQRAIALIGANLNPDPAPGQSYQPGSTGGGIMPAAPVTVGTRAQNQGGGGFVIWDGTRWVDERLYNAGRQPTASQAAAGGVTYPAQGAPDSLGGRVISEGGANMSSGAQIPAASDDGSSYAPGSEPRPGSTPMNPSTGVVTGAQGAPGGIGQPAGGQAGTPIAVPTDATGQAPGAQGSGSPVTVPVPPGAREAIFPASQPADPVGVMAKPPAFRNAWDELANPYGEEYERRLMGEAITRAEEQREAAERIAGARAANRGIMAGGPTNLYAAELADIDRAAFGERVRAMNQAGLKAAELRDSFGTRRAEGIMSAQRDEWGRWKDEQLMPVEIAQAKAQIDNLVAQGRIYGIQAESAKQILENQGWLAFLEFVSKLFPGAAAVIGTR